MNPTTYTVQAPVTLPSIPDDHNLGFVDVENGASPVLKWRDFEDYPVIVQTSTGIRGRLVRIVGNDIPKLPKSGKVTITVEEYIFVTSGDPEVLEAWDADDWHVQEDDA